MTGQKDTAGVIAPPPLVFLGGLALGLGWHFAMANDAIPLDIVLRHVIGGVLIAAGIALLIVAAIGFRRAGTPPEPWQPTRAIVTTGIYAVMRNPMYVAMALIYLGIALAMNSVAALILFVPVIALIEWGAIRREERYLSAKFGEPYDAYRKSVRRWL